jgi:hypothetical protein
MRTRAHLLCGMQCICPAALVAACCGCGVADEPCFRRCSCTGNVVDGSTQRGAHSTCSCIGWELASFRGGSIIKCVGCHDVQPWMVAVSITMTALRLFSSHLRVFVEVSFDLRPLMFSCAPLQTDTPMRWICTTVQQGHGRRLSSVLRAVILRPHRSETSPCSREVTHQVRLCSRGRGDADWHACVE